MCDPFLPAQRTGDRHFLRRMTTAVSELGLSVPFVAAVCVGGGAVCGLPGYATSAR